jgi:phosphosulfolactate synthase (CoM biosynthesis protein A)
LPFIPSSINLLSKEESMDWIKKHVDTVVVLGGILTSVLWMNGKFNEIENKINELEKEIIIIKTVMIMKNIMPTELAYTTIDASPKKSVSTSSTPKPASSP